MFKNSKKNLNKQFPVIRDGRYRKEAINEIVRIFQNVESFIKIQMRSGIGRRHSQTFVKSKKNDWKSDNVKQRMSYKFLHF